MAVRLIAWSGVTLVLWIALLILAYRFGPPSRWARPDPPLSDWPVEPPAVAALLYRPGDPAAAPYATLLDLAARGLYRIERDVSGRRWLWIPPPDPEPPATLLPYERHLWDRLTATPQPGGYAPLDALDLRASRSARDWRDTFVRLLRDDARQRGFLGPRTRWWIPIGMWVALAVPVGLAAAAAWLAHQPENLVWVALGGFLAWAATAELRGTGVRGAGEVPVANCRALRAELAADPPVWTGERGDRRPAYAVALGVPVPGAGPDPFGTARPDVVWSFRTGSWRPLRLTDSSGFTTGDSPALALWMIPVFVGIGGACAAALVVYTVRAVHDVAHRPWLVPLVAAAWAALLWGVRVYWRWVANAVYDARHPPRVLAGPVVYLEAGPDDERWVAIDDGESATAVLHGVDGTFFETLAIGTWVRLEVRPKLGSVVRSTMDG
jgi:hypothetical protein